MEDTSASGSTTTGPTSFSELPTTAWSDASSASPSSTESTAPASAGADTTVPPAADAPTGESSQQAGEPPKERWNDILTNARTKASEEAIAQWKQQYGWAEQIDRGSLQEAIRIAQLAKADPIAYLQDFIKELQTHPTHGAQLKSLAARALAARTQPQGPDLTPIQVQLENGQTIGLFSADQIAAMRQQWLDEAKQQFQPAMQTVEQLQAERAAAADQQRFDRWLEATESDAKSWPHMESEDIRRAVGQELGQMKLADDADIAQLERALDKAYRKVLATTVLPSLSQKTEAKLLDSLKTKAAASTGVNPGSAAPSSPRTYDRFDQLPAEAWR